jgi:hypothetical protein
MMQGISPASAVVDVGPHQNGNGSAGGHVNNRDRRHAEGKRDRDGREAGFAEASDGDGPAEVQ